MLSTYYVSPAGDDTNTGASAAAPFKTIAKVNTLDLNAGDSVLFQGGATFAAPAPSPTNQVGDGGFESGNFNTWTENFDDTAGNSSITTTAGNVHGGSKALRVAGSTAGGRGQVVTSKLKNNTTYVLKYWAKASSGSGDAYAGISFYKGGAAAGIASVKLVGSSYREYSAAFVTPASFDFADVWITKDAGTSVVCIDDFTLNQTSATLLFESSDSGTASNPVTIGSYGSGKATINAGDASALVARNISGFSVRDLNVVGTWDGLSGTGGSGGSGIVIANSLSNDAKLDYIRIDHVDASHFQWQGISIEGDNAKAGFRDVRITNSAAHDNGDVGIRFEGQFDPASTSYAHSDVYVGWCKAYNNGGIPNKGSNSGTGIILGDVDGGTIERSIAWNNGGLCNFSGGGPIGIWAWDSNAVVIQSNESYANKTGGNSLDGGGFDLDGGCTNSILQYNYSHDNDGAGYLMYQFTGARAFGSNIVRFNISQNDGRQGHYAGVYMGGGSGVKNNQIYNNTIYLTPTSDSTIAGIKLTGVGSGNTFRNNIIQTTGGVHAIDTNSAYATSSVLFQANDYYPSGSALGIKWGSALYSDLSTWRATGQEKNGSSSTGTTANPQLVAAGSGPTIGDAAKLHTVTNDQLLATSPLINAGINAAGMTFARDYFGSTAPAGSGPDIGAFEWSTPSLAGGAGNDSYLLRLNADGKFELFVNAPVTAAPTIVWAKNVYSTMSAAGNGGADTFTLDESGGNPLPSGGVTFDGGTGTGDGVVVIGTAANESLAVSATAATPGGTGPAVRFSHTGSVVFDAGAGNDSVFYNNAGINVTFKGSGADTLNINSGAYSFAADARTNTPALTINVSAGATANFNATQHLSALNISGKATVAPGGSLKLAVKSLSIAAGGSLDLNDDALLIDYASSGASPLGLWDGAKYTGITGLIASGRNGGAWDGPGIDSTAAGSAPIFMGLGIAEAAPILALPPGGSGTFEGESVDDTTVIVRYTFVGDADLSRSITSNDYFMFDNGYAGHMSGYLHGDFDYTGRVDGDDAFYLDSNYSDQFLLIDAPATPDSPLLDDASTLSSSGAADKRISLTRPIRFVRPAPHSNARPALPGRTS
jgi:hypothetical protein